MDTPIRQDIALEARDGEISGTLSQSSTMYVVEFVSYNGGHFSLTVHNKMTGNREGFDPELTLEAAIARAQQLMGTLAHHPFPGYEPAEES